jgi:hypothetical protein
MVLVAQVKKTQHFHTAAAMWVLEQYYNKPNKGIFSINTAYLFYNVVATCFGSVTKPSILINNFH